MWTMMMGEDDDRYVVKESTGNNVIRMIEGEMQLVVSITVTYPDNSTIVWSKS